MRSHEARQRVSKLERLERLWQTRAVDKSGTPPCAPFPPNFNVALVDKRGELMRYAALAEKLARSKKLCAGYRLQH